MNIRLAGSLWLVILLAPAQLGAQAPDLWKPYRTPVQAPLELRNSQRLQQMLRAGNVYLTLEDAVALAVENNLDVEIQRHTMKLADAEVRRTRGGGVTRGLAFNLSEAPAGVAGVSTQLLTSASRGMSGSSISTNPFEAGALGMVQTNLGITGSIPQSAGTAVPNFEPYVSGRYNYAHQSLLQTNTSTYGLANLVTGTTTATAGFRQGFGSGASLNATFDNQRVTTNSHRHSYSPYTLANLGVSLTQPLARGFGFSVNRRYQSMAANEVKMAELIFRQQLINTVYGVSRLYYDFAALAEDVKVKEESLRLAEKLFADTKAQVEEGTLATVEMARANAQVFSSRLDLERARGAMEEQEAILKTVLSRRGGEDPEVRRARLIPVQPSSLPGPAPSSEDEMIDTALANRPDQALAGLQIANSELSLKGAMNALKPQVDLTAFAQNNGLAGEVNALSSIQDSVFLGGYGSALAQILRRNYPVYGAGIQFDFPVRNSVAQADAARDEVQLRQSRIRQQQLKNQARLEVEDAMIAVRRAKAGYDAAAQARAYQEESLRAEQAKFEVGASTSYLVIQFQTLLAQSKSSELAARSAYLKAQAALQRATGTILGTYGITVASAR
ncbi:MAG TPA: TolC family protein [Bryobacteraceae bacterium]|nr:TolC family protein [Bryobacteraceae bacterium]